MARFLVAKYLTCGAHNFLPPLARANLFCRYGEGLFCFSSRRIWNPVLQLLYCVIELIFFLKANQVAVGATSFLLIIRRTLLLSN